MADAVRESAKPARAPGPPGGRLVVLSGPAGVGKNTVAELLCRGLPIRRVVTATTRPPRAGEVDGRDYLFLSEDEFRRRLGRGEFLEHATVHGHLYGTPRDQVEAARAAGQDGLLLIDVQGALQVKALCRDALLIFLDAPDAATLTRRLAGRRTESEAERRRRLETAAVERGYIEHYDYRVVNDDLGRAVAEVRAILTGEHPPRKGGKD